MDYERGDFCMSSKKNLIFVGILFLLVGVIFVIVGIVAINQGNGLRNRCTEETIGTVVEVIRESHYSSTDNTYTDTYYPVIEYQVGDLTISHKSSFGQYPPKYTVGQQVEIYYNPNNVEEYIIKGDSTSNIVGIMSIALGSIAVLVGFFAITRKASKMERDDTY